MNAEGKNLDLTGHEVARKIRGNPSLITACGVALEILSESDWLYLLDHQPNSEEVVLRCTKWQQFNPDKAWPGLGDGLAHIKWLASIVKDCAEMAAITDEGYARNYAFVAHAANLQAQKMVV